MQEDVRLFCLPLWSTVEECVHVCLLGLCEHTVGVCGWLFMLNGHPYSSFMGRAIMLRDFVFFSV